MKALFPFYSIGHFINQPHNPTPFEITRFDEMDEPDVDDPHKHTFYEIIWVEQGVARQVIDYQEYRITPGMLFFISPGQLHDFEEWQPLQGGSILFTEEFFLLNHQDKDKLFELSFLDDFYANPCLKPDDANFGHIHKTIQALIEEKNRPNYSATIAQSLLHVLLLQIQRCIDAQAPVTTSKRYVVLYKQFKRLLDAHFAENLTAGAYADTLNITAHHLNHITKQVTGKTATEVIRARTMLEAKRLLTFTDQTVTEIAAQLGMFDSSYFARLFRADTGSSPLDFKRQISESYRMK